MSALLSFTIVGLVSGCIYALTALGLVVTYTTSGIFNVAHGAVGMVGAFAYWQLAVDLGVPAPLALVLVVGILAPLLGAAIEWGLMRRLHAAPLDAAVTVTVGLLLLLLALATIAWDPSVPRTVPQFFAGRTVQVADVLIGWHQLLVVATAAAVALALRVFLYRTRAGTATRAVVDDPDLAALAGASPARSARLGWAIGAALAALAGILLAPLVNLETTTLTLLVINGYAAALVGRLTNLPLTFAGGLLLGLAEAYAVGYLPVGDLLSQVKPIVPMLFLFVILLVLPASRLHGRVPLPAPPHVPGLRRSVTAAAAFVLVAGVLSGWLSLTDLDIASHGVALGVVALSLVPLAGYGGQVALCQLTFAGLGAFAMSAVGGATGSPAGVLAAVLLAGAVGAVIALPALRLRGLYLALATLAFAYGMDFGFFANPRVFTEFQALPVARVALPGLATDDDRVYFLLLCGVFAIAALGVLALRRSTYGRRLVAMGDSPAACATVGVNLTTVKLSVFAGSAALAGLGGALYGGQQGLVGPADFTLLQSLVLLLLVVVMGMRTVTGPLIAGVGLALGPLLQSRVPASLREIVYLAVGAAAIGIGANPNGLVGRTPLARWREHRGRVGPGDPLPTASTAPELEHHAAG